MTVNISPAGGVAAQFFTDDGVPLAGGKLYSYAAGSSTPQTAYTSSSGVTAWSNPIILNSAGRVSGSGEIWLTGNLSYKFILEDSTNVLIATYDNVRGIGDSTDLLAFEALLAGSTGASLVGYLPAVGPATTVQAALIALQAQDVNLTALASINGGQIAGLRNRIINGDMRIAQRSTSSAAGGYSCLDRYNFNFAGTAITASQQTAAVNGISTYVMQLAGVAGNTAQNIYQRIEASNCYDLAGQNVTISFWTYQTTGSAFSLQTSLGYATVKDDFTSTTNISTNTTSIPDATWTYVSFTLNALTANSALGLQLAFFANSPALTTGVFQFAFVQLEIGSVATTFEQRLYGLELMLCQRYFETGLYASALVGSGTTNVAGQVGFFVPMRVSPTVTQGGTYTVTNGTTTFSQSSASFTSTPNPYKTAVNLANFTGLTSTAPYITDSGSSGFNASAEL